MAKHEIDEAAIATAIGRQDSKTEGELKEISRAEELHKQYGVTQRGLKPRHVQLMAIGGAIGVGLWVGIGTVLYKAGPLSLILGYTFWGAFFVWPLFLCVAEMCAYLPIRGSVFELGSRLLHPAVGFTMGWTYFFAGTMLICVEYSAVSTVMAFWLPNVNPGAWIAMAMVVCILLNVVAVKFYGESEFVMASSKIILLFMLVMVTLITMSGGNPTGEAYGFRNWNAGAMHPYYADDENTGRFLGVWSVMIYAAFTVAGPDGVALASGEIQNPRRTIPRVARLVFYRIIGFYVVGVTAVGIICSSRDPNLVAAIENGSGNAGSSPWVVGIKSLGIGTLPHVINAFILFSGWSCGNAYLYNSSRTLYSLAQDGQAPKFLLKCTKNGIPIYCVGIVSLITCITFLVTSNSALEVFLWFVDLTTTALIATYALMLIVYVAWFRARKAQGITNDMIPYAAPFAPYTAYWALFLVFTMLLFVGYDVFSPFEVRGFVTRYFALGFAFFMFGVGYVIYSRKGYKGFTRSIDADLKTGLAEVNEECRHWEEGGIEENERARLAEMSFVRRTWEKMW